MPNIYGKLLIPLLFIFFIHSIAANADGIQNKTKQLQQINQQITQLKSTLIQDKDKQKDLYKDLQQQNLAITKTETELSHLNKKLSQQTIELAKLKIQQQNYQNNLNEQHKSLANQLRLAYYTGREPYLKILFNQQTANTIKRSLNYYAYINKARFELIHSLQDTLAQLANNQREIEQKSISLQQLQQSQTLQHHQLALHKHERQQVLAALNNEIQNKDQQLKQLLINKQTLETVLKKLAENSFKAPPSKVAFAKLKGKLSWPTNGPITKHFGNSIDQSELRYSGVIIAAPLGQSVRSIYQGRVVFANVLPGYGLLLILDHGNGFMSLYGHNQTLYKKVGNTVKAGDLVACVGNSSGRQKTGLYFEIRQNGRATNPEIWCNINNGSRDKLVKDSKINEIL